MKFLWQQSLILLWIAAERMRMLSGLSVRFLSKEPACVALGKTLVLKAQFELQSAEKIRLVTWDRKISSQEVRLVTNALSRDPRVSVEMNQSHLRITGVQNSDYGLYTVTVTDDDGNQISDSVSVLNIERPPAVSLSLKCNLQSKGAWWDSPIFSWWMDGVHMTKNTSEDGSTLYLQESLAQNYTCIINSNQGTSKAQIIQVALKPEPSPDPVKSALIAVVVIETVVITVFIGHNCLKFIQKKNDLHTTS